MFEGMKPGLQFSEKKMIKAATVTLRSVGIGYEVADIAEIAELPEWADRAQGGKMIYIEEARWEEGMNKVGEVFGCTGAEDAAKEDA